MPFFGQSWRRITADVPVRTWVQLGFQLQGFLAGYFFHPEDRTESTRRSTPARMGGSRFVCLKLTFAWLTLGTFRPNPRVGGLVWNLDSVQQKLDTERQRYGRGCLKMRLIFFPQVLSSFP